MAIGWKGSLTGLLVTGLCPAGAAGSNSREESFRRQELDRDTRIAARQAATRLMATLDRHRVALQQRGKQR